MSFSQLGLDPWLIKNLKTLKITNPTEIQLNAIPEILKGRNCVCSALTGSGKTAAFVLPILNELRKDPFGVFAIVLAPTRELAFQIDEQFKTINMNSMQLKTLVVSGGMDLVRQSVGLSRKPHIVIACPGRFSDLLINCDKSMFKFTKYLVIDESDRVLNPQFSNNLYKIFSVVPKDRQILLFSATITKAIKDAAKDSFIYDCAPRYNVVERLKQFCLFMPFMVRDAYILFLLNQLQNKSIIIFMPTSNECAKLQHMSDAFGYKSQCLHSDMSQRDRLDSLFNFKSGNINILIATDVASRGLDIPYVDYVISYSPPNCVTDYIHRVGRTARAGNKGTAITLVSQHDVKLVLNIEQETNSKLEEYPMQKKDVEEEDFLKKVLMARNEAEMYLDELPRKKRKM
eukprot:NODE_288_length_11703_cov_0.386591.p1 type:complete len:401 gc:universal NODE_288_length_11703_cov_0.386591:9523-8321(-)